MSQKRNSHAWRRCLHLTMVVYDLNVYDLYMVCAPVFQLCLVRQRIGCYVLTQWSLLRMSLRGMCTMSHEHLLEPSYLHNFNKALIIKRASSHPHNIIIQMWVFICIIHASNPHKLLLIHSAHINRWVAWLVRMWDCTLGSKHGSKLPEKLSGACVPQYIKSWVVTRIYFITCNTIIQFQQNNVRKMGSGLG